MRLEITDDCCATARRLVADGLDPSELLEFCRGDMVCLRGTARAFASRQLQETAEGGPRHVPYDPLQAERLVQLRSNRRRLHALKPAPPCST
jgi:hypothetical protein